MTQLRSKILRASLTGISAAVFAIVLAPSQALAACAETDAGKNWDCNGVIAASQAETFTVDQWHGVLQGGTINPAIITGNGGNAAVDITVTGDVEGTFDVQDGAIITHPNGGGTRNGLLITSTTTTSANPIHVNIDGDISTADANGSAVVLTGANTTTFDLNIGATSTLSGVVNGISVTQSGILTIDVADGASVTGTNVGILAASTAASGTTTITVDGDVTGTNSAGVSLSNSAGGALNVTVNESGTVFGNSSSWGILAQASGGNGNTSITVDGAVTDGGIFSSVVGTGTNTLDIGSDASVATTAGPGVSFSAVNGLLTINLGENATVDGVSSGITASSSGSGNVIIDMDDNSTVTASSGQGLLVGTTTGGYTITAENITATLDNAIDATAGANSSIDVNGLVKGLGTGAGSATINLNTAATFTTTLTNNDGGTITTISGNSSNLAVRGQGNGNIVFDNDSTLIGRVDFSAMGGAGTVTMSNTASDTWTVNGTNTFTANADTLTNGPAGHIDATNATFNMGGGTDDVQNYGQFDINGDVVVSNTEAFHNGNGGNTGTLDMHNGNDDSTDSMTINSLFTANTGHSKLVVDAALGSLSTPNVDFPTDSSDLLDITSGGSTGVTLVTVHNAADQSFQTTSGILVVDGSSHAGDFILDPSQAHYVASKDAIDAGMFDYHLVYDAGADQHLLQSTPSNEPLEMAALVGVAQDIWSGTSPWQDRQADLRDSVATHSHEFNPGAWVKGLGRWTSRDVSQSVSTGGVTTTNTADYDQKTYGAIAGIDGSKEISGGGRILVGGQGGYVSSQVDFDGGNDADIKGAVAGAYVTFVKNGFFADGAFKANILSMNYNAASLGGSADADVRSYGGEFDAGQRFVLNTLGVNGLSDAFIEPVVNLSYVRTTIDDITFAATTVDFDDNQSLRAGGGLRAGATVADTNAMKARFAVTGRVMNEFLGDNKVTLHQAGPDTTVTDNFDGVFGEGGVSLNLFGKGANAGLSGFVNGSVKVGQDYLSPGVTAGARFEW